MTEIEPQLKTMQKERTMKKVIYLMIAAFLMSATPSMVYACPWMDSTSIEEKTEKYMEKLTSKLSLTEEQAAQVETFVTEKLTKKKAIWDAKMAEIKVVKEEFSTKIKTVLTDEQKVKYDEMKAEHKKGSMKGSGYEHKGSSHEMKGSGNEHGGSDMEKKGSGSDG